MAVASRLESNRRTKPDQFHGVVLAGQKKYWCRAMVLRKGAEYIFVKNQHTCKAKLNESLHAQIVAEVKTGV